MLDNDALLLDLVWSAKNNKGVDLTVQFGRLIYTFAVQICHNHVSS